MKINSHSLSTMVVGLSGAPFWGLLSSYLLFTSKNSTLFSLLIGFIISFIFIAMILKFYSIKSKLSLSNKFKYLFGKFSYFINILFILLSFLIFTFLLFRLTSFISSQYLIETPKILLHALLLSVVFYIVSKRIETLSRLSVISLYIAITIFIFNFSVLLSNVNIDNYFPINNINIYNTLKSSIIFSLYLSVPTIYINVINKDSIIDKEVFNKKFLKIYLLSFIIMFLVVLTTLGIFGIELTNIFDYPLYSVLKRIQFLSFLDLIENISIIIWLLYIIIATSTIMLTIVNSIKDTFRLQSKKSDIITYSILFINSILIPELLFNNSIIIENFEYIYYPLYTGIVIILIVLVSLIINSIKKEHK